MQRLSGLLALAAIASTAPLMAETITPAAGSIQATVLIDSSVNVIDIDVRTPFGGGVLFPVGVDQTILTDTFATPDFGNKTLFGFDNPDQNSTFNFIFDPNTANLSNAGVFSIEGAGTLLSGSAIPAVAPFLSPLEFTFGVSTTDAVPNSQLFLVTTFLESVQTTDAPEPATVVTCLAALLTGIGFVRARRPAAGRPKTV